MKVISTPKTFVTGDILPPEDLNEGYIYARDVVADLAMKRLSKWTYPIQFVTDVGAAYTQASGELLVHRFTPPHTTVLERGFLHANMLSDADVRVHITKASDGSTPTGATAPYLSTDGAVADADEDVFDINVNKVVLDAGVEYKITVSAASGTFSLQRFDVILHGVCDRWNTAGTTSVPDFDPTPFTDASFADATVVAANNAALATEAAKFANAKTSPHPVSFSKHGFLSGTSINLRKFTIPRFATGRAQAVIKRIYLYVIMASGAGGTVKAILRDSSGTILETITANVAGVASPFQVSVDSGALSRSLVGAASETTSNDYTIEFENSAAAVDCTRAVAVMWIARA